MPRPGKREHASPSCQDAASSSGSTQANAHSKSFSGPSGESPGTPFTNHADDLRFFPSPPIKYSSNHCDELRLMMQMELQKSSQQTEAQLQSLSESLATQHQKQMEALSVQICAEVRKAAGTTGFEAHKAAASPSDQVQLPHSVDTRQDNHEEAWGSSFPPIKVVRVQSNRSVKEASSCSPDKFTHVDDGGCAPSGLSKASLPVETLGTEKVGRWKTSTATAGYQRADVSTTDSVHGSYGSGRRRISGRRSIVRGSEVRKGLSTGCFRRWVSMVESTYFDYLSAFIIAVNSIVIAMQTDWAAQHVGEEMPRGYQLLEMCFTVWFSFELVARASVQGVGFLSPRNRDIWWNLLDIVIVFAALIERVFEYFGSKIETSVGFTGLRILRILRFVRILRVLRVIQFFRDLRRLVIGISSCVSALFWCIMLLILIMFIFSIFFTQIVTDALEDQTRNQASFSGGALDSSNYATLLRTHLTLFQSITGGVDWGNASDPLLVISPALCLLFVAYIAFAVLCVLNVVTSVFVEKNESENVLEELSMRNNNLYAMKEVMKSAGDSARRDFDDLRYHEFEKFVANGHLAKYFNKLGLVVDEYNSRVLFDMLDFDSSGTVDIHEFVNGCSELCTSVRSIDIARMRHEFRKRLADQEILGKLTENRIRNVELSVLDIERCCVAMLKAMHLELPAAARQDLDGLIDRPSMRSTPDHPSTNSVVSPPCPTQLEPLHLVDA